jgi:DNA-binding GntR family transcriptional regulator
VHGRGNLRSARAERRPQLRDEAAAHFRKLIVSGALRRGEEIPLGRVAREIDVSRTPVREALLLLVQDGWMIQGPNRGFRVAPVLRQDVADAYLVNAFVVGELAARAALAISAEDVEQLRELDREIGEDDDEDGGSGSADPEYLNSLVNELIFRAADSPRLRWFSLTASRLVPRDHWATIPGWLELNRTGHRAIVDALDRRDADAARRLMADHMQQAGDLLVAHLDRSGFWADGDGASGASRSSREARSASSAAAASTRR